MFYQNSPANGHVVDRTVLLGRLNLLIFPAIFVLSAASDRGPNFLFLLVDDWGFGDVDACPPHVPYEDCALRPKDGDNARKRNLKTPRIKQLASEGMIFPNWYAPRAICSPSRAAMLSGRDPIRYGDINEWVRIFPSAGSRGGFPHEEKTTAEYLRELNYSTGYAGKWHLGLSNGKDDHHYAAWNHGYDEVEYFVEGSNGEPCVPGLHGGGDDNLYHMCSFSHVLRKPGEILEQPIRWENSTARELLGTLSFIEKHAADRNPWFFTHAFTSVHVPWKLSRHFVTDPVGRLWTDQVRELDWAVGILMDQLEVTGQDENTVVVLTADNGPYLEFASSECPQNCRLKNHSWTGPEGFGCTPCSPSTVSHAGPLSGGKGQTWEGGVRVPGIWRWKGHIPAGTVNPVVAGTLDFHPTAVALAGGKVDASIALDGRDISAFLLDPSRSWPAQKEPEGTFFYWCGVQLMAVRLGRFKVVWYAQKWVGGDMHTETRSDYCAGTGKCCAGSPTRLCTCSAYHNFTDVAKFPELQGNPVVVDLVKFPDENLELKENPTAEATVRLIAQATLLREEKLRSVARDRGLDPTESAESIEHALFTLPDLMSVDFCIALPHPISILNHTVPVCPDALIPPDKQLPEFKPYENCVSPSPTDPCKQRFPCCQQDGYKGPFEYIITDKNGESRQCGCFKQPLGHSLFPETRVLNSSSVRRWQLLEENGDMWRVDRTKTCWAENSTHDNENRCRNIAEYGLNIMPTGTVWNEPYLPEVNDVEIRV